MTTPDQPGVTFNVSGPVVPDSIQTSRTFPAAAPSLREALERIERLTDAGTDGDMGFAVIEVRDIARAALASPEPAPDLIERAIAAACPDPAAHDEAAVTEGLDVERLRRALANLRYPEWDDVDDIATEYARLSAEQPDTDPVIDNR